jgi:hypothetical protein
MKAPTEKAEKVSPKQHALIALMRVTPVILLLHKSTSMWTALPAGDTAKLTRIIQHVDQYSCSLTAFSIPILYQNN